MTSCGLGNPNLPLPGDPNLNNQVLSARPVFGGVEVSWTYPETNAHALAYVRLYRSTQNNFSSAIQLGNYAGSAHYDRINLEQSVTYFYWIVMVSINGTVGETIGPASATALPFAEEIASILQGKVTASGLDQALSDKINLITDVSSSLDTEEQTRLLGDDVLSQLLAELGDDLNTVDTLVANEITSRVSGDNALVASINLILAQSESNAAAILEEQAVRATADSATAISVETLQTNVNGALGSIQTLQSVVNNLNGITASYTVKIDANGYVSGFGLFGSNNESAFVVKADTFAVGSPGYGSKYPFVVGTVNGLPSVVIDAPTVIADGAIENLMIGNIIHSDDYNPSSPYSDGWAIHKSGVAIFSEVYVRGDIEATSLKAGSVIVKTLNIQGNAVTVPSNASAPASFQTVSTTPAVVLTVTVDFGSDSSAWPGDVIVIASNNWLGYSNASASGQVAVTQGNTTSSRKGQMGTTLVDGASGAVTTQHMFGTPSSRYQTYSLVSWVEGVPASNYKQGARSISVLGAKR